MANETNNKTITAPANASGLCFALRIPLVRLRLDSHVTDDIEWHAFKPLPFLATECPASAGHFHLPP